MAAVRGGPQRSRADHRAAGQPPNSAILNTRSISDKDEFAAVIGLSWPGRPIRSLVAEDRNARGVRDRTGPEPPSLFTACSRDRPPPAGMARDSYLWERAKAQVEQPVRSQMDTWERRSNDS
jgi:hypothetical protein